MRVHILYKKDGETIDYGCIFFYDGRDSVCITESIGCGETYFTDKSIKKHIYLIRFIRGEKYIITNNKKHADILRRF